jgi:hypothetical protein
MAARTLFDLNDTELKTALFQEKADPNIVYPLQPRWLDPKSKTTILPSLLLQDAAVFGSFERVHLLLEAGADPYGRDDETGWTVAEWAQYRQDRDLRFMEFFKSLDTCRELHQRIFPDLQKELMETIFHPDRLFRRGYFDT